MSRTLAIINVAFACIITVQGKGFLADDSFDETLSKDLIAAMDEVLGCGEHGVSEEQKTYIESSIMPMWITLPKTNGNLDWKSVRYIAHRYFMQTSSLMIRGLEPSRALNHTDMGIAEILSQEAPSHTDSLFSGKNKKQGFSLHDTISLIITLERLVFDSEAALLEKVIKEAGGRKGQTFNRRQMQRVLENYMVHWMMGEDQESIEVLMKNRTFLEAAFPQWSALAHFVNGRIELMLRERGLEPLGTSAGKMIMNGRFTKDDAHTVVGGVTRTFQDFWQSECHDMKDQLVGMDRDGTGRVRLSDFYGTGLDKDWRFGESEAYLKDLGVLDDSSMIRGKQVMIANYLQAASNCIVATPHYLVCCKNECEEMMAEIEEHVRTPYALPADILNVVGNMSSPSGVDDDPPMLEGSLREQLLRIAETNGGKIPIHGRLFAQWLHYVFPRECAYPQKAGKYASHTLTPGAFGGVDDYLSSKEEMTKHAQKSGDNFDDSVIDENWMSQWSSDEEFFADYKDMNGKGGIGRGFAFGVFALIIAAGMFAFGIVGGTKRMPGSIANNNVRSHMV